MLVHFWASLLRETNVLRSAPRQGRNHATLKN
jgi:hypothetical protein